MIEGGLFPLIMFLSLLDFVLSPLKNQDYKFLIINLVFKKNLTNIYTTD